MKQLTEHPWKSLDENLDIGSVVKGKIVTVVDYGAFLELTPGVEGLIHVSEMSWSQHLRNPSDFMKNGDDMEAVVLSIDRNEKCPSLGVKQLTKDLGLIINYLRSTLLVPFIQVRLEILLILVYF